MPSSEPRYTCPIVDDYKSELQEFKSNLLYWIGQLADCSARDLLDKIEEIKEEVKQEIDNFTERKIEEVRDSNIRLREWGKEWEEEAKQLQINLDNKDSQIYNLEEQVYNLNKELISFQESEKEIINA